MTQHWKVVGGAAAGGIMVREGRELKSEEVKQRLSTGSIVKEVELAGQRLKYDLVEGDGPQSGWVSLTVQNKDIMVKTAGPIVRMTLDYQRSEACVERCQQEMAKSVKSWTPISHDTVRDNHMKKAPGMFYGIEFPWSEETLIKMGPLWLTKAFQKAGTLSKTNSVVQIIPESKIKVTTGNNGGKFLFEVKYKRMEPGLDTKLFAKVPHDYETKLSDRLSSSVNKQPMEFYELNTSRLLESTLPVKIPKYYFGDISNETSNWILITEQVPFADWTPLDFAGKLVESGTRNPPLAPYLLEGPYDKCMDWTLRGSPEEYYMALVKSGAKMAGLHKAGKMGDEQFLATQFEYSGKRPAEMWGAQAAACSGQPPSQMKAKVDFALKFMSEEGKVVFPAFCQTSDFKSKFTNTIMTLNAYAAESNHWRHSDEDYIAISHNNLNVDNAFFWRDEEGKLDLGALDWGSMGSKSIGFKLWYWLYCGDFEPLTENMDRYIQCFIDTYEEFGGPVLDPQTLRTQFILSAFEQMFGLISAVPQIYKMCAKKEWPTIQNRYDSRIGENIDGKSTLRLYIQVMNTVVAICEDPRWRGAHVVEKWVGEYSKMSGHPKKTEKMIFP